MIKVEKLNPFGRMCISLGMLPSSYKESMTYEEQLLWFFKFLDETVIPTVNNNADAVEELQALYIQVKTFVDEYFDNLDVQEEINNKLDAMAQDGSLADLLKSVTYYKYCLNAYDYGCAGDGNTDDTAKLIELLEYADSVGIRYIDGQHKTYGVSDSITVDGYKLINFNFKYVGDTVLDNVTGKQIFTIENSILENVNFDGNDINVGAFYSESGNNKFINCKAEKCKWYAFAFVGSSNNIIEKCTAYRNGGVFLGGVFHFTDNANFNTIINSKAIENIGKGFDTLRSNNIIFTNCYGYNNLYENFSPRQYCYDIKFDTCESIKNDDSDAFFESKGQVIVPTDNSGIKCSRGAYNAVISNCNIVQEGGTNVVSGIHNQGCQNITIENCKIDSGNNGILVSWHPQDGAQYPASSPDNTSILNNEITAPIGTFLTLTASYDQIKNIIIEKNKISSSSYAIRSEDITNCIINENELITTGTGTPIYIYSSHNNTNYNDYKITKNIITGASTNSANINYCNNIILKENTITSSSSGNGISFTNCSNPIIDNNIFHCFTGISSGTCTGMKISNNTYNPLGEGAHYLWRATAQVDNTGIFNNNHFLGDGAPSNQVNLNYASITDNVRRVITGVTAAPASGTWNRGDIAISLNPATSTCTGWVCAVNGTPGTWYKIPYDNQ